LQDIGETTLTIRVDYTDFEYFEALISAGRARLPTTWLVLTPAAVSRLWEHVRRAYLDGKPDGPGPYAATGWVVRGSTPG
jgi:hypothetical protein